jgi:exopolysaccharide biosynthesis polyprenyl glycosylphosphotransferase
MSARRPSAAYVTGTAAENGRQRVGRGTIDPRAHARLEGLEAQLTQRVDRRGHSLRRLLLLSDAAAVAFAFVPVAAYAGQLGGRGSFVSNLPLLVLAVPVALLLAYGHGLYHVHSRGAEHGAAEEAGPILRMSMLWAWVMLLIFRATKISPLAIEQIAIFWLLLVSFEFGLRAATRAFARRRPWYPENAIVIGTGAQVSAIVRKVLRHPEWGLNVVACVDYANASDRLGYIDHIAVLRGDVDVIEMIEQLDVQRVMVAWSTHLADSTEARFDLVRELTDKDIHVNLIPSWFEVLGARLELSELEGMPLLTVPLMRLSRSSLLLKRALDVAVSACALAVFAPLIALCAIAIKLDTPGPVFFRQRRVGREGEHFELLKFRSMVADADKIKLDVAALNVHGGGVDRGMFKIPADPRITRVGAFLRRTSLDELPQLWNILLGDMSLVGPRPLIENEARQVSGRFRRRLELTPGLTGLWQVNGRSEIPFEQMVNLDYLYVTSWSLWSDIKILIKTIPAVAASRGAY